MWDLAKECIWICIQPDRLRKLDLVASRITESYVHTVPIYHWNRRWNFATLKTNLYFKDLSICTLTEEESVLMQMMRLWVNIGTLASGYTKPGQFLQLKIGDSKPAFIAIASAPDSESEVVELLIKNQGGTSEALCGLRAGEELSASPVIGKGFPVEKISPDDTKVVYLFATGSGISPVKALIESGALQVRQKWYNNGLLGALQQVVCWIGPEYK